MSDYFKTLSYKILERYIYIYIYIYIYRYALGLLAPELERVKKI